MTAHSRAVASNQHREMLREVAFERLEAGHRRVRAYALRVGKDNKKPAGSRPMTC